MQVFATPALNYIPPSIFSFLRVSQALLPLGLFARYKEGSPKFQNTIVFTHLVIGITGVTIPGFLIFVGDHLAGPDIVAVLQPTIPIYVSIYSTLVKLERFSWFKILGQAMAISGCLVLLHVDHMDLGNQVVLGTFIVVIQALSYAIFLIIMQYHLRSNPYPLTVFFRSSVWGAGALLVYNLVTWPSFDWRQVPWWAWASLSYCGLCVSFLAHGMIAWAVLKVQAVMPALNACLQPLLTVMLAAAVLGLGLTLRDLVSMVMIIIGLMVVVIIKFQEQNASTKEKEETLDLENEGSTDDLEVTLLPSTARSS
eukprot:TRINITY_DN41460_c0_g1_i4.p1 TRINITY_DN41460_c0_g1~~TRINITY_DN41460_c0_g1_i4.p1  ORF type:complete len:311 (+),score=33.94 TRINITY_DN41460_c0_g1_i4:201-1133(+)